MSFPASDAVYMHGEYLKTVGGNPDNDAYFAVIKSISTGAKEIKVIDAPQVPVYVTKPQFRINTAKKEHESKDHLDMYRTRVNKMGDTLWNAINNPGRWRQPMGHVAPRKMMSNPYVYGADIDFGVHLKSAYKKANKGNMPPEFQIGFLDIETDVMKASGHDHEVILITFMDWSGNTYVGISKTFYLNHTVEEAEKMWHGRIEKELYNRLNSKGKAIMDKNGPLKVEFKILENEVELIRWTFSKIHATKPDFIGVWNIAYDVPFLINRLMFRGIDPASIFCHQDVPFRYRRCEFHEDKGKQGDHMVDRWSWLHCTDYSRWYDAMCLYGRLRKAKPKEPSYKLDAIGTKEVGAGKLNFEDEITDERAKVNWHQTMQEFYQVHYSVYNVVDVFLMWLMEKKNGDVRNMMNLIGDSTLDCFAHQSVQLKNYYYNYLNERGFIPASVGEPLYQPWDELIANKGGAVLDPSRADISVPYLIEDDIAIRGTRMTCDIDVSLTYIGDFQEQSWSKKLLNCWNLSEAA